MLPEDILSRRRYGVPLSDAMACCIDNEFVAQKDHFRSKAEEHPPQGMGGVGDVVDIMPFATGP